MGLGAQGIQGWRFTTAVFDAVGRDGVGCDAVGRGLGDAVEELPGFPFLTVITTWFSSSVETLIQVSPSHSSAFTAGALIPVNVQNRERIRQK